MQKLVRVVFNGYATYLTRGWGGFALQSFEGNIFKLINIRIEKFL